MRISARIEPGFHARAGLERYAVAFIVRRVGQE